jgi:hypothetical protein
MKKFSAVLVNLQNPREKVWGILLAIQASGITVRGIDLNSFDDWSRSAGRGDTEMGLSTMFLPIHRVERVNQDETVGSVRSLAELFEERVGQDVWTYLGLKPGLPAGASAGSVRGDWMSLEEAEADYIERVLEDCDGDRAAAAEILGLTKAALDKKIG